MATPMKSMYTGKLTGLIPASFRNWLYSPHAMAHPNPKGSAMPAAPTLNAIRQLLTRNLKSTSRPTRNKKRTRPKLAAKFRAGIEAVGKIALLNPGIRPITEGPNKMPAITSAMTRGCRSRDKGKCKILQRIRMIEACNTVLSMIFALGISSSQPV
jgi:hypothetical protein